MKHPLLKCNRGWHWDVMLLTYGRGRLLWTDGFDVDDHW